MVLSTVQEVLGINECGPLAVENDLPQRGGAAAPPCLILAGSLHRGDRLLDRVGNRT
jgi:hypothetical protein